MQLEVLIGLGKLLGWTNGLNLRTGVYLCHSMEECQSR